MAEFDLKRLDVAIQYISRMTSGRNPVTNRPAPENEVLTNPNVNRCLQFVGEILKEVKNNGGIVGKAPKSEKAAKPPLSRIYPYEKLQNYSYRQDQQISFFLQQINELFTEEEAKAVTFQATRITNWLRAKGYLEKRMMEDIGKEASVPTEKGAAIGIYSERAGMAPNEYYRIYYNEQAQRFLLDNLRQILEDYEANRAQRNAERNEARREAKRIAAEMDQARRSRSASPVPIDDDPAFSSLVSSLPAQEPFDLPGGNFADFFGDGWENADEGIPW